MGSVGKQRNVFAIHGHGQFINGKKKKKNENDIPSGKTTFFAFDDNYLLKYAMCVANTVSKVKCSLK